MTTMVSEFQKLLSPRVAASLADAAPMRSEHISAIAINAVTHQQRPNTGAVIFSCDNHENLFNRLHQQFKVFGIHSAISVGRGSSATGGWATQSCAFTLCEHIHLR